MKKKNIAQQIKNTLARFAKDLASGNLSGYRTTKLVRNEDGTFRRIVTDNPKLIK